MDMIEKVKEFFRLEDEKTKAKVEVLDVINIEGKYQIAKVRYNENFSLYFPFIEGKKCFYNFGVNNFETAMFSAIAENNKSSQDHVSSCLKLLDLK
ncbi:hypothetical protein [Clostridium beijerinckii]|jgi:hypothetical protein|uniref:hypothetical protein n=1 Tax=Clostridium beijerinckii TaxID=1520 RepID=UPI00156E0873|nr:hypothetical protein [Clostridium beijerinckii]NRU52394.1 hypothetical protein [Clostridium beijerinckii]NRU52694.1 hypothetical protein [Clostridium beijerinckii]NYC68736.1 hypothetical protein [Clostridium beijerinckii]NYC91885.1 hypothetical protein [Clostridium beijerinckii]